MSTQDLLERRAERGTPRGAANVWTNAQPQGQHPKFSGTWLFRLALTLLIGMLAAFVLVPTDTTNVTDSEDSGVEEVADEVKQSPLDNGVAPLLLSGFELVGVEQLPPLVPTGTETVIYAHPTDPFTNPIISVESRGDTHIWRGANNWPIVPHPNELEGGDDKAPPADSGLVEVARFESEEGYVSPNGGWELDFFRIAPGELGGRVELRAHALSSAELLRVASTHFTVGGERSMTEVDVLGEQGLALSVAGDNFAFVWALDGYIYDANTVRGGSMTVDELDLVDEATWTDEFALIGVRDRDLEQQNYWRLLAVLGLGLLIGSPLFFVLTKNWTALKIYGVFLIPGLVTSLTFFGSIGVTVGWLVVMARPEPAPTRKSRAEA